MLVSNTLTYADIFQRLEEAEQHVGRKITPICYSAAEWISKVNNKNHFIMKVLLQEKIFLIGTESELKKLR